MKEYKTEQYDDEPPFACCLFHKDTRPEEQNFLDMLRFTFFPYFQVYSFSFFWLIMNIFVYIYCLHFDHFPDSQGSDKNQFLRVSQKALFEMGENYPYFLVKKFHYYRLLTSTVLNRNLYHFVVGGLGIIMFGSYVEQLVGFKRILLLAITTGVGAEVVRNIFIYRSSLDSVTPICGLIGYMLGYFVTKANTKWKNYQRQKVHMLGIMLFMLLLYIQLSYFYRNISFISIMAAFGLGFIFYFCDPDQKYENVRLLSIIALIFVIGGAGLWLFFKTNPPLMAY